MKSAALALLLPLVSSLLAKTASAGYTNYHGRNATALLFRRDFEDDKYNHPDRLIEKFRAFGIDYRLEYNVDALPNTGVVSKVPWPGSFWPTMFDGINDRWNKEKPQDLGPSGKYAQAFGLDPVALENRISAKMGIDSAQAQRTRACNSQADCGEGARCAFRKGVPKNGPGRCIPEWWGICHAWSTASVMEDEPRCPVTVNGVKFYAADIEALLTVFYDAFRPNYVFMGSRCDKPQLGSAGLDTHGREPDLKCRDINPGVFHLIVTNHVGLDKKSIIVDVDATSEVWNYPLVGYRITAKTLISRADAGKYFNAASYPFEPNAYRLMRVKMTLLWVTESYPTAWPLVYDNKVDPYYVDNKSVEYILELDANNDIIGGQWIGESKKDLPDFVWIPVSKNEALSKNPIIFGSGGQGDGIRFSDVRDLLKQSIEGKCDTQADATWN